MMPKDLKELLRAFNDHAVKYLVVGAMHLACTPNREQPKTSISLSGRMKRIATRYFAHSPNTVRLWAI
jgi:hypothetical protein